MSMREDFEAWAAVRWELEPDDFRRDKFDRYRITSVGCAYEQWQAAYAAGQKAEREACAKLCEDIEERHLSSGAYASVVYDRSVRAGGQVDGAKECAAAIRARE